MDLKMSVTLVLLHFVGFIMSQNVAMTRQHPIQTMFATNGRATYMQATGTNNMMAAQVVPSSTGAMNHQLGSQYSLHINPYTRATNELLLDLRQQLLTRSIKFDELFRSLLSNSKRSLHNMFVETYGMQYEHNTEIFTSLFEFLEQYYAEGKINLTKSMENFFERLYQKIFQVFNNNKMFTPSYLECATNELANLKPFKDVPDKLINEIRHSFVAARTFHQALNNGMDIIKVLISLGQPQQCTNLINDKLLKNTLATNNQQTTAIRLPCLSFCEQVMSKCIGKPNLNALNDRWISYVDALKDLATKLSSNYNIETIIIPLDVQISEAIMNFQENATAISQHVFQSCGRAGHINDQHMLHPYKPASNRLVTRAAPLPGPMAISNRHSQQQNTGGFHQPSIGFTLRGHLRSSAREGLTHSASVLGDSTKFGNNSPQHIESIKNYMLSTRNFWSSLPNAVCTSNHTLGPNATTTRKQSNCFQEQLGLSDMNTDVRYKTDIDQLVRRLDVMRMKIQRALEGQELDWSNTADTRPTPFGFPGLVNNLKPITTTTTTTTTTVPPDSDRDENEEDDVIEEEGSGVEEYAPSDNDDEFDSTTEGGDSFDNRDKETENETGEEDSTTSSSSSSETPTQFDSSNDHQSNTIDQPPPPNPDDTQSNLITIPNQMGAQKSNQMSTLLLVSRETHLMFALPSLVALFFIASQFQIHLTFTHRTKA